MIPELALRAEAQYQLLPTLTRRSGFGVFPFPISRQSHVVGWLYRSAP